MKTRQQDWAQRAYECVGAQQNKEKEAEYKRFSKSFPALVHTCGLAQAVAFGQAKAPEPYMDDLAKVIGQTDQRTFAHSARTAPVRLYQRLSLDTLAGATWLKRYAEALLKGDDDDRSSVS